MTTHKLIGNDYKYPYFCTSGGDIYYVDDVAERIYPEFGLASREVDERHYGKLTKYVSVPLLHKDGGRTPAADAAEMIARSIFGVPMGVPGFVRLKDRHLYNIGIENLEFVQTARYTDNIIALWNEEGRTVVDKNLERLECADEDFENLGKSEGKIAYNTQPVKTDLMDRDRSVVAEALYILVEDRSFSGKDAMEALMLTDADSPLTLYLEGKDIVEDKAIEAMALARLKDQEGQEVETFTDEEVRGERAKLSPSFKPRLYNTDLNKMGLNIDKKS